MTEPAAPWWSAYTSSSVLGNLQCTFLSMNWCIIGVSGIGLGATSRDWWAPIPLTIGVIMLLIYPCFVVLFGCCVLPFLKTRFEMREVRKARVAPDVPTIRVETQVPAVRGPAGFHFAVENGGFWCGGTGLLVFRVEARSPAAAAGVKVGDVLEEINGQRVREMPVERAADLMNSIFQEAAEKPTALRFVGMVFMRPAPTSLTVPTITHLIDEQRDV
jgi:hypothetical protein